MSLPLSTRVNLCTRKHLLKKLAAPILPTGIPSRRKSGFGVPLDLWFRQSGSLGRYLDLICQPLLVDQIGFSRTMLRNMVDSHVSRRADLGDLLWEILSLELWCRTFVTCSAGDSTAQLFSRNPSDATR